MRLRYRLASLPLAVVLLALTPALPTTAQPGLAPAEVSAAAVSPSADDAVNRVLAISVDGLNPLAITQLASKGAPNFHRMMREGAYTFNARTANEMTVTLPNHTGMLTGRRVAKAQGGHGVTFNSDRGKTVHETAGGYVSSVFDVVHDNGGSTALYSAKTKFAIYSRTWNTNGGPDVVGADNGRQKIDRVTFDTDNARLVGRLTTELKQSPRTFTFLHISLPDAVGHRYGFMSARYLAAVQETDRLLGTVLNTIAGTPVLRQHMLVILTADHGGNGASHSDVNNPQNYRIPFMAWGPGVDSGRQLYDLNPTLAYPFITRPGYSGPQPIRNADLANLSTDVLDLPTVPGSQLNRTRELNVFRG